MATKSVRLLSLARPERLVIAGRSRIFDLGAALLTVAGALLAFIAAGALFVLAIYLMGMLPAALV